jgi:tyrosine-protein phosphatase SIW14
MGLQGRFARIGTAAVLAVLLTLPVTAAPPAGSLAAIRIDNFGEINGHYYRGAQPGARDYTDLAAFGIKTIIDLQLDGDASEAAQVKNAGMKYVRIAMTTRVVPTAEQIAQFLQTVTDPANQPIYVHCAGGRHRTGVMTAIYRMTQEGWTADRAFAEMKRYRFGADFLHPEFKSFVYTYHPAPAAPAVSVASRQASADGAMNDGAQR